MFGDNFVVIFIFLFCFVCLRSNCEWINTERVEQLVRQWAPLIWLSPDEKFMPLNVEEFLGNVNIADEKGKTLPQNRHLSRFLQYNSNRFFLVPNEPLENLKSNFTSFLYGKNPREYPSVSIYAVVTYCSPFTSRDVSTLYNNRTNEFLPPFYVTFWMFYPYNEGKDICFLGKVPTPLIFSKCFGHFVKLGNHIGDWEHMSLSFTGRTTHPEKLFLSVHDAGAYYGFDKGSTTFKFETKMPRKGVAQVPKFPDFIRLQGGHPVLFAAEGSHGLWSTPGDHEFIRVPKIVDKNGYGTPWKTWASVKFYHFGKTEIPPWMSFKGKWGNPKKKCVLLKKFGLCEYTEGPRGLLRESQDFYC